MRKKKRKLLATVMIVLIGFILYENALFSKVRHKRYL